MMFNLDRRAALCLERRLAYSMLELLIALGLVGALLAVAWSLLSTYQKAELNGWNLAERIRTVESVRQWLEHDMLHVVHFQQADAYFVGNTSGFTTTICPSVDPLPFFDKLLNSTNNSTMTIESDISQELGLVDSAEDPPGRHPWPLDCIRVEYRMVPGSRQSTAKTSKIDGGSNLPSPNIMGATNALASQDDRMLVRRELGVRPAHHENDQDLRSESSERLLTSEDLYRLSEPQDSTSTYTLRESILPGISNVQFNYFDGTHWKSNWNSQILNQLPSAIAIRFNSNVDRNAMRLSPSIPAEIDSESVFEWEESLDASSQWETNVDGEGMDSFESDSRHDMRIVVRLWPSPSTPNSSLSGP